MSDLLNATLGAVGQVGDAFDKFTGGRALRGLAAGKPRELLSVVPFSDTTGLTDAKDKTSGRDLTDAYGLTRKGDDSFGSHAIGFLADNALSPGNLIGAYGAFKAAPTLAKGVTQGAKALSGLDLLDHVAGGAKKVGNLLAQDGSNLSSPGRLAGSQQGGIHGLLSGEAGTLDLSAFMDKASPFAGDSLMKHLPWPGRTDISDNVRHAAAFVGPQYPGGKDKLLNAIQGHSDKWGLLAKNLVDHPMVDRIASEIPEGSKFLGNGAEAIALKTPQGGIIRMAPSESSWGSAGRADIPEVLQPFRSIQIRTPGAPDYGWRGPWTVEHLPMVNPVDPSGAEFDRIHQIIHGLRGTGNPDVMRHADALSDAIYQVGEGSERLGDGLEKMVRQNHPLMDPWDFHGGNVAFTSEGNAIGHDGGMVRSKRGEAPIERYSPSTPHPVDLEYALQRGGPEAIRDALSRGLDIGTSGQGLASIPGVDLGHLRASRRLIDDTLKKHGMVEPGPTNLPGVEAMALEPGGYADAAFSPSNRGSGLLEALSNRPQNVGPTPADRALAIGKENKIPTGIFAPDDMARLVSRGNLSQSAAERAMAFYFGRQHGIMLNGNHPEWRNSDLMNTLMEIGGPKGSKWFSSADPDHLMTHEVGHAMHRQGLGVDEYMDNPKLKAIDPEPAKFLAENLSRYSSKDPKEAVAELFAALKSGRKFDPSSQSGLAELLRGYGGENLWQNLGDNGLLKALGLSALGMLGVGAATNPEMN